MEPFRTGVRGLLPCTLASRDSVAKTPYFPETISYLVLIPGETGDSGHNLCSDALGKDRSFSRMIIGRVLEAVPDSGLGLIIGDSHRFHTR